MSSEIKVGEYVRTKRQGISKIRYINDNRPINKYSGETNRYDNDGDEYFMPIKTTEITKHSKNIIDLIEVRRLCEWNNGI